MCNWLGAAPSRCQLVPRKKLGTAPSQLLTAQYVAYHKIMMQHYFCDLLCSNLQRYFQFSLPCNMLYEYMTTAATLQKKTYIYISPCEIPKKSACILHLSFFHAMRHVWTRAVQDDDHLNQGFFHSYVRTFFCSQLCLHFLLSHSVLDCPS